MGSVAVVGGAGTGIYFLLDSKGEQKELKPKPEPGSQELTTSPSITTFPSS